MTPWRPSDLDRARAVDVLRRGYLDGRISTDTFEARVAFAYRTRSSSALRELLSDLPVRAGLDRVGARLLRFATGRNGGDPLAPCSTIMLSRCAPRRLIVGRSAQCDIVLAAEAVSRRHALIDHVRGGWRVADLDSTNGTYVDGERVDVAPLIIGVRLQVADVLLDVT